MKKLISEEYVIQKYKSGEKIIYLDGEYIITPLAKDKLKDLGMNVTNKPKESVSDSVKSLGGAKGTIAIGCDHPALETKNVIIKFLEELNYTVVDVGTYTKDSCDYPDYAMAVAEKVISSEVEFGIMFDATGIPSAITANKIPGIRAATCYNEFSAWSAQNHNNANMLVMGAMTLGIETIKSIINKWIETEYEGGRHQRRLDKITELESKLMRKF